MAAIFSLEKWIEITSRGTSGDQVSDILASWKKDGNTLSAHIVELELASNHLGNLLAVLHGDGGHYQAEHGDAKATNDAMEKHYTLVNRAGGQAINSNVVVKWTNLPDNQDA